MADLFLGEDDVVEAGAGVVGLEVEAVELVFAVLIGLEFGLEVVLFLAGSEAAVLAQGGREQSGDGEESGGEMHLGRVWINVCGR